MHGGVCLAVDVDPVVIRQRIDEGLVDVQVSSLEDGIAMAEKAKRQGDPLGIGLLGNAGEILPKLLDSHTHLVFGGSRVADIQVWDVPVFEDVIYRLGK